MWETLLTIFNIVGPAVCIVTIIALRRAWKRAEQTVRVQQRAYLAEIDAQCAERRRMIQAVWEKGVNIKTLRAKFTRENLFLVTSGTVPARGPAKLGGMPEGGQDAQGNQG